jgi:uncharacterized protein involved in exopolysaccharide biosynthesis
MKWAICLALRLYPQWWRRRYGRELEALVEDSGTGWSAVFDIARGAFVMQIRDFRSIPLLAALIGASIGTVTYLRAPALYESSSTIRLSGGQNSESSLAFRDSLARALSGTEARAATSVVLMKSGGESSVVKISHTARNAKDAQEVVKVLVAAALTGSGDGVARGTVVESPVLPTTPQRAHGAATVPFGGGLGLVLGAAFVALRRVPGARRTDNVHSR